MKKIIIFSLCILIGLTIVSAAEQDVILLTLKYDSGNVSVQSFLKTTGVFYPPVSPPMTGYNLSIISTDNKVLYSQLFDFSLEIHISPPDPSWFDEQGNQIKFGDSEASQTIILNTSTIELLLPYYENADRIEIVDKQGLKIISLDLNPQNEVVESLSNENNQKILNPFKNPEKNPEEKVYCSKGKADYKPGKFKILYCNLRNIFIKEGYSSCLCSA